MYIRMWAGAKFTAISEKKTLGEWQYDCSQHAILHERWCCTAAAQFVESRTACSSEHHEYTITSDHDRRAA